MKGNYGMKKNNKGFSLIELIIAVAILVVLSGLLAPQLIKYVERSRESKDMQALDSVYVAVNTALTNEAAYNKFTTDHTTDRTDLKLETILGADDAFSKEVQSILGKTEVKLQSKRAKGSAGNGIIWVEVRIDSTTDDGVTGLTVGVYAGAAGTSAPTNYNGDFAIGNVTPTKVTTPSS